MRSKLTPHSRRLTRLYNHEDSPKGPKWAIANMKPDIWPCEMEGLETLRELEIKGVREDGGLLYPAICDECAVRLGLLW